MSGLKVRRVLSPSHGRVSVSVDASGIRLAGDENLGDELLRGLKYVASFLSLGLLGVGAAYRFDAGEPLWGAALAVGALLLGYPFLRLLAESAIGYLLLPVMLVFMVVMLPFKAGRRRIKGWWTKTAEDALFTPAAEVVGIAVRTGWRTSVTVRRRDRDPLRLRAWGARGRRLAAVMHQR